MTGIELDKIDLSNISGSLKETKPDPVEAQPDVQLSIPAHPETIKREEKARTSTPAKKSASTNLVGVIVGLVLMSGIFALVLSITGVVYVPFLSEDPFEETVSLREPRSLVVTAYRLNETLKDISSPGSSFSSIKKIKKTLAIISDVKDYDSQWEQSVHNFVSGFMRIPREDAKQAEGMENIRAFYESPLTKGYANHVDGYLTSYSQLLLFCKSNWKALSDRKSQKKHRYDRLYLQYRLAQKKYKSSYIRFLETSQHLQSLYPDLNDYLPYAKSHETFWRNRPDR